MPGTPQSKELRRRRTELQRAIGNKVRELRERGRDGGVRWTQQGLANRIQDLLGEEGSSLTEQKAVSKIENGTQPLTLEVLDVLARALDVDPLVLLESAFHYPPTNAAAIAQRRLEEFRSRVDVAIDKICGTIESNADSELGRRAGTALSQLAVHAPMVLPGAVGMLEGLVLASAMEAAAAHTSEGMDAVRARISKDQPSKELGTMFAAAASPAEMMTFLTAFYFQLSATLSFAARSKTAALETPS